MFRMHRASFAVLALSLSLGLAGAANAKIGGALNLKDEGSFFVGGRQVRSEHPSTASFPVAPGVITVGQMYVQYRIPARATGLPVIMVHGSNHTGATFETTPDGREGWATYFVRRGHPVYVVDHAGRGRSGFDPSAINAVKSGAADASNLPTFNVYPRESAWVNFRFGPAYGVTFPRLQFPIEALDQYMAQIVPNAEASLEGGGNNTIDGLSALLDRIGPAVVLLHSQSGPYGLQAAIRRPKLVKAVVSVEGGCTPVDPASAEVFAAIPVLAVWGDNSVGAAGYNGNTRRDGCAAMIKAMQSRNPRSELIWLPERGVHGNSHMMMMDRNNLDIADRILRWIKASTK